MGLLFRLALFAILGLLIYRAIKGMNRKEGTPPKNPFQILGVNSDSTSDEIKRAYKSKLAEYHPDKVTHMAPEIQEVAKKRTQEIIDAYNNLIKSGKVR